MLPHQHILSVAAIAFTSLTPLPLRGSLR